MGALLFWLVVGTLSGASALVLVQGMGLDGVHVRRRIVRPG